MRASDGSPTTANTADKSSLDGTSIGQSQTRAFTTWRSQDVRGRSLAVAIDCTRNGLATSRTLYT